LQKVVLMLAAAACHLAPPQQAELLLCWKIAAAQKPNLFKAHCCQTAAILCGSMQPRNSSMT